ncbi:MAG: LysR family transcriptional regulator [Pseudomonadota bacterium]
MRLRHLEVFNAIMDVGSITAAGAALGISQSSVSKVLQHFEMQLGWSLFERQAGKLSPTPEARRLYRDSEKLVAHLKTVRRLAATFSRGVDSAVRVVATPSLAQALLPAAVTAWRRRHPGERCEISTFHTVDMVSRLMLGEADFGLTLDNPCRDGICARLLLEHHMLVAAPPGTWSEAECSTPLPIDELGQQVVGIATTDSLGALVQGVVDARECEWHCVSVAQTHLLAAALAAAGHGLALVDPFTASAMPVQTRRSQPSIPVGLWLLTREESKLSPAAQLLVDAVGSHARTCAA